MTLSLFDDGEQAARLHSGFESPAAFRAALAEQVGVAAEELGDDAALRADWIDTPLGAMIAVSDRSALHLLEFADRNQLAAGLRKLWARVDGDVGVGRYEPVEQIEAELARYFAGAGAAFTVPLAEHGSPFSREVWRALREIPVGRTCSYGDLARRIGRPSATRAVARANGANPLAIVVPCHRVIGADGTLTGYAGGLWRKRELLDRERQMARRAAGRERRGPAAGSPEK